MATRLLVLTANLADQQWAADLAEGGFELAAADTLPGAVRAILAGAPDIVLALTEGREAAEVCGVLCALGPAPIVMGGIGWSDSHTAACLDAGADATLALPLPAREACARLRAVARRIQRSATALDRSCVEIGPLMLDMNARMAWWRGVAVSLTPTEFDILAVLAEQPGRVVSNRELLTRVWGEEYADDVHYIRLYVGYLRHKLEDDPHSPRVIMNRWGVGYCLLTSDGGSEAATPPTRTDMAEVGRFATSIAPAR